MSTKFYHYTSIDTLYNMLEKSIEKDKDTFIDYLKLWATNIDYMNDRTERKLFTDALKNSVSTYAENQGVRLNSEAKAKLESLCHIDAYIISLSELHDDLNMWRGYGGNGSGVNIEFDFQNIQAFYKTSTGHFKCEHSYRPVKCKYLFPEECSVNGDFIARVYNFITKEPLASPKGYEDVRLMREIKDIATITKHNAYRSEQEWRFVLSPESIPKTIFSNGIFKPYREFKVPLNAISAVTIGPCIESDYATESFKRYIKTKLNSETQIKVSEIPYRG